MFQCDAESYRYSHIFKLYCYPYLEIYPQKSSLPLHPVYIGLIMSTAIEIVLPLQLNNQLSDGLKIPHGVKAEIEIYTLYIFVLNFLYNNVFDMTMIACFHIFNYTRYCIYNIAMGFQSMQNIYRSYLRGYCHQESLFLYPIPRPRHIAAITEKPGGSPMLSSAMFLSDC